jgi:hypothetical protein
MNPDNTDPTRSYLSYHPLWEEGLLRRLPVAMESLLDLGEDPSTSLGVAGLTGRRDSRTGHHSRKVEGEDVLTDLGIPFAEDVARSPGQFATALHKKLRHWIEFLWKRRKAERAVKLPRP